MTGHIMSLSKIPRDITVFGTLKELCSTFFDQMPHKNIKAVTSAVITMEVIHRAIVQEAAQKLDLRGGKLTQYLKENPEFIKSLTRHREIASTIYKLGVSIEQITYVHIHGSRKIRDDYGLMANDSLIIAFMQKHKISHLVTNDGDFKRIPDITVWLPR